MIAIPAMGVRSLPTLQRNQAYPLAGIFVEAAAEKLGIAKLRQHLHGAPASTWETACEEAGATPEELESAFRAAIGRP